MSKTHAKLLVLSSLLLATNVYASCEVIHGHGDIICSGNASTVSPGGALPIALQNDFATALEASVPVDALEDVTSTSEASANQAAVGLECSWSRDKTNGDTNYCSLPISYTIHNEIDPRRRLTIKMPITWVDSENPAMPGKTHHIGLGVSYTYPLAARWYVTPSLNYTYAAMGDFPVKSDLVSSSLTSTYFFKDGGFDLSLGNMIGYARTANESADSGLAPPPKMHYNTLRNGMMASKPGVFFGNKVYWEGAVVHTLFSGTQTYTDSQFEVSLTVGNKRSYKVTAGGYRLGLTLFDAGQVHGGKVAFGYWF